MKLSLSFALAASFAAAIAQPTPTDPVAQILGAVPARELGPTTMGGRIMDIAVYDREPRVFCVAFASGGLWRTENGGTTMTPIFDRMPTQSFGAVAIDPTDPKVIWAGTGEESSRNSTSWGAGLFKSVDAGKTWEPLGLAETRHTARIAIHPKDTKTVFVATLGGLWDQTTDRGLFKTKDGGKSWRKVLDAGPKAGAIDVVFDPKNPSVLLAATWERFRLPYNFYSRGPGSGLWRSTDGGESWRRVTRGLPEGDLGRIGLSVMKSNPKVWVATIDAAAGGFFRSEDGGQSWSKVNTLNPRPFYFSRPVQDPLDENRVYICGVNVHVSDDKGRTFRQAPWPIHPDHHAMWVDPTDSMHLIIGNDGGLSQSRDRGATWDFIDNMAVGQFYAIGADMRKPYFVYGGLQDNGSWGGPTQTRQGHVAYHHWYGVGGGDGFFVQVDQEDWRWLYSESQGGNVSRLNQVTGESKFIKPRPPQGERYRFNWSSPIFLSPHNSATVYFGGNRLFKSVNRGDNWKVVSPDLTTNDPEKQKPVVGDAVNSGAETHCTIITIGESPLKQGVLWVGTDDGQLQVSQDDGVTWANVIANVPGVPKNTWVSRVEPSRFAEGRCYVTFDGHRAGDKSPYVFVTEDFGATWKPLVSGLVQDQVAYVVREGRRNEDLLFLGTERGLFVSLDRGASWRRYETEPWPLAVRVDDLLIHPRELDLVVGTHGRSIWILPVAALEQLTKANREKDVFVCEPQTVYGLGRVSGGGAWDGHGRFESNNTQPGTQIFYWLKQGTTEKVVVQLVDAAGREVAKLDGKGDKGLNVVTWRPSRRTAVRTGDLGIVLKVGETETRGTVLRVENLVDAPASPVGLED